MSELRILRPGDGHLAGHAMPERPPAIVEPHIARAQEFAAWEFAASVDQLKNRVKNDPEFRAWYDHAQGIGG